MRTRAIRRVAELLSVPEGFVVELCDEGIVAFETDELDFEVVVERVRVSWTLHHELGVNLAGIEVALNLLSLIQRDRQHLAGS